MYTVRDFGDMIADRVRMAAYEAALRRTVKPGSVVVDIGAGTGIFTLLACRFGARKVYAIDPNPAIDVARALVKDNGFRDRVEFISKMSTEVELPERADVIVSDVRGVLPLAPGSVAALLDARTRWLRPGGALIPMRDELRVSVVEAPLLHRTFVDPWDTLHFGFDASAARASATSGWCHDRAEPIMLEQILAPAETWATVDYEHATGPDVGGTVTLRTNRAGTGHGLALWFDATLTHEDRFSTQPGTRCVYSRAFFPWPSPVVLEAGAVIEARISAVQVGDDYTFSWTSRFPGNPGVPGGEFHQTDFFSLVRMGDLLTGEDHRPKKVGPRGLATARALELLSSGASVGEVATTLLQVFPGQFRSREAALFAVRAIVRKYA